ncbi:MAG: peptidylprolyl isomerase, partial [Melioribacteraceae bacterium]
MKCFSVIFLSLISALSQINAQNFTVDREVARAGNRPVYESEFRQRLEFVPQIGRTASDPDSVYKLEILYSMIGEKLLAQRGEELGLDTTIFVSVPVKYMEKLLVRDALYRIEILDKSRIDSAEFAAGIDRYFKKISAGYFYFNSEDSVYKIYSLLKQNLSPESIISKDNIYKDNFRKVEIKFGDLEAEAEKKLFSLKKNQFTEPLRMGDNWYIFAVDSITNHTQANQKELESAEKQVRQIVRQRNSNSSYDDFYGKFLKNKKSAANSKLYNSFSAKIKNLYAAEKDKLVSSKDSLFSFSNQKALLIENLFGRDSLNTVFINSNGSTLQFKEFIREFAFEGFTYSIKDTIPL